ncbi:hypothetical protein DUNSADRAFT_9546 [Dunaliella salina]|uniref:Uncharacterized protein n=1 Tax=Dunaliella salina TaxID=3046 RepID=A0ABQ7GH54_DUNSA|nr:hypothetical protein DUNSADRAFT_9546 [Dunaliella salina]KAF5833935.1 hypothetical protein DUNSADRAFT_9546 [Dunaliella salina]|eukprot:KAF5833931.1 hypothetical protein DUNSADRAFT_9546 [Dunaliella salina]
MKQEFDEDSPGSKDNTAYAKRLKDSKTNFENMKLEFAQASPGSKYSADKATLRYAANRAAYGQASPGSKDSTAHAKRLKGNRENSKTWSANIKREFDEASPGSKGLTKYAKRQEAQKASWHAKRLKKMGAPFCARMSGRLRSSLPGRLF